MNTYIMYLSRYIDAMLFRAGSKQRRDLLKNVTHLQDKSLTYTVHISRRA